MPRYQLITYDVWGNEKDGFEVNQAFTTNTFYDIPDYRIEDDFDLIACLKKQGCFKKHIRKSCIEIDGDDQTLYFSYRGRPEFELRRVES